MQIQSSSMPKQAKALSRKVFPSLHTRYGKWLQQKERQIIAKILSGVESPQTYDSEELFQQLQTAYPPPAKYEYDALSTWSRGVKRSLQLIQVSNLHKPGADLLEAGCGDGMTGYALSCYGHRIQLVDLEDWREERAQNVPFIRGDLCAQLPLTSESFDVIYSFNTFEHLDDPASTLNELIRICKKNGLIYLEFDPLYASPWGLHAHRTIHIPYVQFLFSQPFIDEKLQEIGIYDLGKERTKLQAVNRWRLAQFQALWQRQDCEIVSSSFIKEFSYLDLVQRFPKAFQGLNLTLEDLTIKGIKIALRKT